MAAVTPADKPAADDLLRTLDDFNLAPWQREFIERVLTVETPAATPPPRDLGAPVLDVFVPGVPQPQGNHRVSRAGYTYEANPKLKPWRDAVAIVARRAWLGRPPLDEPVAVDVHFVMPKPRRPKFDRPATKPDADKLQRAIGDALETAGVVANDSRIVMWRVVKVYAERNQPAGARIILRPAPTEAYDPAESTPTPGGPRP